MTASSNQGSSRMCRSLYGFLPFVVGAAGLIVSLYVLGDDPHVKDGTSWFQIFSPPLFGILTALVLMSRKSSTDARWIAFGIGFLMLALPYQVMDDPSRDPGLLLWLFGLVGLAPTIGLFFGYSLAPRGLGYLGAILGAIAALAMVYVNISPGGILGLGAFFLVAAMFGQDLIGRTQAAEATSPPP